MIEIIVSSSQFSWRVDIGVDRTQDQVKRLTTKDVEKFFKRYEAPLSSNTSSAMLILFLS